jgi:hypothetical protein
MSERAEGFKNGYAHAVLDMKIANQGRRKRKGILDVALGFAFCTGVAALLMMLWVFWNEAFLGHGVLLIEPNVPLALAEFAITIAGIAASTYGILFGEYGRKDP